MNPLRSRVADTQARELIVGELRLHVRLGTEAVYRVCDWTDTLVNVEVVNAPGLRRGQRFTLTREAVTNMSVISNQLESGSPPTGG